MRRLGCFLEAGKALAALGTLPFLRAFCASAKRAKLQARLNRSATEHGMAVPKMQAMSEAEYLVWHPQQEDRYEYVDGHPQLKFAGWDGPKLMTGARQGHNAIAGNCYSLLKQMLKGRGCRPYISDGRVATPKGNYRFPDVVVDCGAFRPSAIGLEEPTIVIEVLSKSTHWIDTTKKLADYQSVPSIQHIVLLAQDEMRGQCWNRADGWSVVYFEGANGEVDLPGLGVRMGLAEVYEGALEEG